MAFGMELFHHEPAQPQPTFIAFSIYSISGPTERPKRKSKIKKKYEGALATIEFHFEIRLLSLILCSLMTCVSELGLPGATA